MKLTKRIFEFDNYRKYLKYFYECSKEENGKFSLRYFSRIAGFKSHSVLRQVMEGQRNLAAPSIAKFTMALKLNREEAEYFRNLVLFNQATSTEEKQIYAEEILRSKGYKRYHSPLLASQYNYFSHWYFVVVRELVGLPGFKEDMEWISKEINPAISTSEAKTALEELEKLGLIVRDKSGKLTQADAHLETPDEVVSSSFAKCHKDFIKRAGESIDTVSREKRDISGVTFGMSVEAMEKIKERIHAFRKEIVDIASQHPDPNSVYQLNLQIFPLAGAHTKKGESK
jgi:uncharacterized protein (TIGR02147 family)